jgi:hypothetical protein
LTNQVFSTGNLQRDKFIRFAKNNPLTPTFIVKAESSAQFI